MVVFIGLPFTDLADQNPAHISYNAFELYAFHSSGVECFFFRCFYVNLYFKIELILIVL